MKKLFSIYFLLLLGGVSLYGQQSNVSVYSGGEVYKSTADKETEIETSNFLYAKIMRIEVDKNSKKITCLFRISEGVTGFSLTHLRDVKDSKTNMMLMWDSANNKKYYVSNALDVYGTMIITLEQYVNGESITLTFKNVKREQ